MRDIRGSRDRRQVASSVCGRKLRLFCIEQMELRSRSHALYRLFAIEAGIAGPGDEHSPSRVRFRPPLRLTFRFRVQPSGEASSYSRPVLGAGGTLCGADRADQARSETKFAQFANVGSPVSRPAGRVRSRERDRQGRRTLSAWPSGR
jgi:hypothetical protein